MIDTPRNDFKDALTGKKLCLGLWLGLSDAYCAELCASCDYDWLLVDGEHAPNDLRSILATLQAVAPYRSHPVVRIPEGNVALIKQVMEIGATTLLVPMVESAEQARELVRAMRYPPEGVRGVGSGLARSSRWNAYAKYLSDANERACLLVQVETQGALARVKEIASVEGVDGVFIGPADLSASMGLLGQPAHPQVRAQVEAGIRAILEAGKAPGILCTDENLARAYMKVGAQFIAIGVDTTLLASAAKSLIARFRSESRGLSADSSSHYQEA